MTAPSRREQLADKLAESSFMRNVVGPRVLKPMSDWYESRVEGPDEPDVGDAPEPPTRAAAGADTAGAGEAVTGVGTDSPTQAISADVPDGLTEGASVAGADTVDPTEIDLRVDPQPSVEVESAVDATRSDTGTTDTSSSLASARAAEAFLSGPGAGEAPAPETAPLQAAGALDETPDANPGLVATVIDIPKTRLERIKAIAMAVKDRVKNHNLAVVAAGIAFWGLLAIPAVLTAVLSIYGMFAEPDKVETQIEDNLSSLPEDARSIITGQLESVAGASGGGLAVGAAIGILLALWTSSGAVAKVIATLNTIWGVTEDRKFFKLRGMALGITFGAIVFVIGAAFLLAVLPAVLSEVGLADAGRWLLNAGRFPALLLFMAIGLAILYWLGPNRTARFRPLTWGAILATLLWVAVSGLFSVYTASFASYNETYGSLGAVVILLMWLYLTAFMVLVGAEIDASREDLDAQTP